MSRNHRFPAALLMLAVLCLAAPAVSAQDEATPLEPAATGETAPSDAVIHAGKLPDSPFYLARNTPVAIELLEELDTATTRSGTVFRYRTVQDVKGGDDVVIPKGAVGTGVVRLSRRGTRTVPARFHLTFGEVPSVEGRGVKLGFTGPALRFSPQLGDATAIIGGYFENGTQRITVPAGARLWTVVEYPYGTRRIQAGEEGASYYLFRPRTADEQPAPSGRPSR